MAETCPSPEKCLFAGCNGDCHPPIAAFTPTDSRITAQLLARDVAWHSSSASPFKTRDADRTRRLLVAAS
jgi:hypothetical protein